MPKPRKPPKPSPAAGRAMDGAADASAQQHSRKLMVDLNSAIDLESFWKACLQLIELHLPHRSCSLMFNIVGLKPTSAKHHVVQSRDPEYEPPTSLTISGPFLERHPQIKLYTYSQIASEDPDADRRRLAQEPQPEWNDFIHLAFWQGGRPDAVLSIHRPLDHSVITDEERTFLELLHPMIEAGLRRLRSLHALKSKQVAYEKYLHKLPLAVMFADAQGEQLFATSEGERLCERWNRGLRGNSPAVQNMQLPQNVGRLAARASRGASVSIRHPALKDLSVIIDENWQLPNLQLHSGFVITFHNDATPVRGADELSSTAFAILQKLSPSERRVAVLTAKGLSNDDIAERLSRSRRTIEFQLHCIFRKLEIRSRSQLILVLNRPG